MRHLCMKGEILSLAGWRNEYIAEKYALTVNIKKK